MERTKEFENLLEDAEGAAKARMEDAAYEEPSIGNEEPEDDDDASEDEVHEDTGTVEESCESPAFDVRSHLSLLREQHVAAIENIDELLEAMNTDPELEAYLRLYSIVA